MLSVVDEDQAALMPLHAAAVATAPSGAVAARRPDYGFMSRRRQGGGPTANDGPRVASGPARASSPGARAPSRRRSVLRPGRISVRITPSAPDLRAGMITPVRSGGAHGTAWTHLGIRAGLEAPRRASRLLRTRRAQVCCRGPQVTIAGCGRRRTGSRADTPVETLRALSSGYRCSGVNLEVETGCPRVRPGRSRIMGGTREHPGGEEGIWRS